MSDARAGASARKRAMDLLARREHSAAEIRTKLRARDFDEIEADEAIEGLVQGALVKAR